MTARAPDPIFLRLQALVAGRFSLEREIGRGGMGVVYLARDVALERPVAIKVLAPALAARADMRERFLREARLAAQCFHPHIVPIHAVEEAEDLAWIVMAYVRGETLADRLRRQGALDPAETQRLAREVGWALAYAHQHGVVHRDIKPENLLIDASTERFVIADFGIAQGGEHSITPIGTAVVGTARYMAPEQAAGEVIDGRADLYALGVTLFIAAAGRAPFDGGTTHELAVQRATLSAPSVKRYAPALPLTLTRAIDRCLATSPDARYRDASAFLSAIEPDAREQPVAVALHATREHAASARSLLVWGSVLALVTLLTAVGERSGSIGRAILIDVGQIAVAILASMSALRMFEAFFEARRALTRGHDHHEIVRALVGHEAATHGAAGLGRRQIVAVSQLGIGGAVALAQGWLSGLSLPSMVAESVQVLSLFLPPLLIARASTTLLNTTGLSRLLRERVTIPMATCATRILGRFVGVHGSTRQSPLDDAPTEVLLVRAVESAHQGASDSQRVVLGDVHRIARRLATEVGALRTNLRQLDEQESNALALRDSTACASALDALRAARATVQARLQTAICALEALRLDALQQSANSLGDGLTEQLEVVRDVQRRVDALRDVRRLLASPTPF